MKSQNVLDPEPCCVPKKSDVHRQHLQGCMTGPCELALQTGPSGLQDCGLRRLLAQSARLAPGELLCVGACVLDQSLAALGLPQLEQSLHLHLSHTLSCDLQWRHRQVSLYLKVYG